MNKSLAPLIIFLAIVLLVTVVLVNTHKSEKSFKLDLESLPSMRLGSFGASKTVSPPRGEAAPSREFDSAVHKLLRLSDSRLNAGDINAAEDCLKTIIVLQPDNYIATATLSELYFLQGKHKESEALFKNLARLSPDNYVVYNNISIAKACQGKVKEALLHADKAAGLNPSSGSVLLNLAALNSVAGDIKDAVENFKAAHEILGPDILPLAFDPVFDNIRNHPDFATIVLDEKKKARDAAKKTSGDKNEQNQGTPRTNKQ